MFTVADAPAVGLPMPEEVDIPKTSVVALLVTAGPISHQLHTGILATHLLDLERRWGNFRGELIHTSGANISKARNEILRRFLDETDAEWAWMIDSDMAIKDDTLPRLLCAAEVSGAKAIGALCCMIADDGPIPTVFQLGDQAAGEVTRVMLDYPDNTVVQVAATGAACLLVHRTVLEAMRDQSPQLTYPWIWEEEITGQWVSEDILFSLRINAAGFPVFVDCTHEVGHVKGGTVWWPSDIRKGRGFPEPKNYAIIPSKTLDFAGDTVKQLLGSDLDGIIVIDNTDDGDLADLPANVIRMPDAGIHEMWNAGIEWCLADAKQRRNVNLLFLNDDLELGPRFVTRMVEALRSDGNLVAVSGNYDQRKGPLVEEVTDICAGRYDGTGGFAGFAFAARGEWFGSGYRFPTECKWWFGDNDLVQAAALSGVGKVGIAIDAHVVHIDGGSKTGGDWSGFADQIREDEAAFNARWETIRSSGQFPVDQPSQRPTWTVAVVSSIYGGYDEPCPLVRQHGVSKYLLVTDTHTDCEPWVSRIVPRHGVDPRHAGKAAKYQPWEHTDADIVVWLDGRVQTVNPGFVSWLIDMLGDADLALYRHPMRTSILDEAEAALIENPAKYAGRDLVGQAKHYLTDTYVDDRLWQTTFYVARRNERTLAMGRRWQEEQDRFPDCLLDQIPLPPVIAECGVKVVDLPGGFWDQHGRLFVLRPHIDGT